VDISWSSCEFATPPITKHQRAPAAFEKVSYAMEISAKTVRRDWNFANAWLQAESYGKGR